MRAQPFLGMITLQKTRVMGRFKKFLSNKISLAILGCVVLCSFLNCNDGCNDCIELTAKDILVVDAEGNNLVFGAESVYNLDDISITANGQKSELLILMEPENVLRFFLEEGTMEYILKLSDSVTETLRFELAERKSDQCCGTKTISESTYLNGNRIANTDVIRVVK